METFLNQACKRIQTTMIGSLSKMENSFGHLWGHFKEGPLTEQEENFADLWDETRNSILNQGNAQIRNLQQEYWKIMGNKSIPLTMKTTIRSELKPPKN